MPAPCCSVRTRISTGPSKADATASSSTDARGAPCVRLLGPPGGSLARATTALLARHGLALVQLAPGDAIPASFWGAPEAGLVGARLHARDDTPLHSVLHEACHFVCMDPARRARLHTDAGGDDAEECAVCYLSIVLSEHLAGFGLDAMLADMDAWGYSFRLGSARAWFERDADDARAWLERHDLLGRDGAPTWRVRGA